MIAFSHDWVTRVEIRERRTARRLVLHDEILAVNRDDSGGVVEQVVDDVVGVVSAVDSWWFAACGQS
ncbi:MAG: hypothetical protein IT177_14260 [Acidobacteria bacterium]|nr:hypothetical protein [Acidobacteriota bacterium]